MGVLPVFELAQKGRRMAAGRSVRKHGGHTDAAGEAFAAELTKRRPGRNRSLRNCVIQRAQVSDTVR